MKLARVSLTSNWRQKAARSWMRDSSFAIVRGLARLHLGLVAERALDLRHPVGLEHVPGLHVLEVAQDDAAVEALADLLGVVLLAAQRSEGPVVDHLALAQQAHAAVAEDRAVRHVRAGDHADLARLEESTDLHMS